MARQVTVLRVFVASPGDVEEERNCLENVTRELNLVWVANLGIQLELVKWETHAYPDFRNHAQSVINEQISDDYDIFVGIMWCLAGTPTECAQSGTIEEFNRAKERFDADPNAVRILVYFKDSPIEPSKLDLEQMQVVADFRSRLGKEGGLYWKFRTVDEFERHVRLHLTRHVEDWRGRSRTSADTERDTHPVRETPTLVALEDPSKDDEEPGLLDLVEAFEDAFTELGEVAEQIGDATTEVGAMMKKRTAEINKVKEQAGSQTVGRKAVRRSLANVALDLDKYVARMDDLLPFFNSHLEAGVSAFAAAMPILVGFPQAEGEQNRIRDEVKTLRETMSQAADSLEEFRSAVSSLPSMTTVMNRSRRATSKVIQRQIDTMRSAQLQLAEVEHFLERDLSM